MKIKWSGILAVVVIVIGITAYKRHTVHAAATSENHPPRVLLVADLSEADSADACADIIRSVRATRQRGIPVQELTPDSKSEMLRRYHVLTIPTVLIIDRSGEVVSRFEGEDHQTVTAVREQLAQLH